eukprot:TRINITY_DN46316_c0_g1_i1.p1 TRINITY_DN46316_c0_g1~~TRINITY_DN46316_c0_g1_i1.p1  ORF type:complete len:205 (-),score=21.39 TRINITY_DN46316_c0_g1_i1:27-641(-)
MIGNDISSTTPLLPRKKDAAFADESCADTLVYPQHLVWPVQLTAPLPCFSFLVALSVGFYGLAILSLCLAITSINWWWYPVRGNPWRNIDRAVVVLCTFYSLFVGTQLYDPVGCLWISCIMFVATVIIINELTAHHGRKGDLDEETREHYQRLHLLVHSIFAHVALNVIACILMITYCSVMEESSVKFRNKHDGPDPADVSVPW